MLAACTIFDTLGPPPKANSSKTCINPVGATHFLFKTKDPLLVMPTKLKFQHGSTNKLKLRHIFGAACNLDLSQLDSSPESCNFHRFPPGFFYHFMPLTFIDIFGTKIFQKQHLGLHTETFSARKLTCFGCRHFSLLTDKSDKCLR